MNISVNSEILSIVVPAYSEQSTIESVVEALIQVPHLLEIVVVNDGSKDGIGKILDTLAQKYHKVTVIHHSTNKGKTAALKNGFRATQGEVAQTLCEDFRQYTQHTSIYPAYGWNPSYFTKLTS